MPRKAEKACGGLEVGSSLVCRVDEGTGTCPNPLISAEWPWTRFIQLLSEQVVSVLALYSLPAHAPCWGYNCLDHKWSQGKCGQSNGLRDPEWLVSVDDAEGFGQHLLCGHPELLLCLLGGNRSTKRKLLHFHLEESEWLKERKEVCFQVPFTLDVLGFLSLVNQAQLLQSQETEIGICSAPNSRLRARFLVPWTHYLQQGSE